MSSCKTCKWFNVGHRTCGATSKERLVSEKFLCPAYKHRDDDAIKRKLYEYQGPAYYFSQYIGEYSLRTQAVSLKQAINNVKFQIKKDRRLANNAVIYISEENVKEVTEDLNINKEENNHEDKNN